MRPPLLLLSLACGFLAACVTPPKPVEGSNTVTGTVRPAMAHTVKGRISAYSTEPEGKTQQFHGGFELALDPPQGDSGQLMLLTPLGSTVAILGWTKSSAMLRRPSSDGGGVQIYESLQAMLDQTIGIALTSRMLSNWLIGMPIDDMPSQPLGANHFSQLNWDIQYTLSDETKRPKLITMKRAALGMLPPAELKLVVDEMN